MLCAKGSLLLGFLLVASQSFASVPDTGESHIIVSIVDDGRAYTYRKGSGTYRVAFNYTGENWTHADVAAIKIATRQPIAILPMQYTEPGGMQPGAIVYEKNIGKRWNTITQAAMAERLRDRGFFVLTPSITHYGENLPGFQALEHFIAGVHKGNNNVQTVVLTADADIANPQNPTPGAQMLVTGTNPRDREWESLIQDHIQPFYEAVNLGNIGPRVRGGLSDKEGASAAWHPLIERAAEYGPQVTIIEVARAIDIVEKAGSIEAGGEWAGPLFDGLADGMRIWATQHNAQNRP
jgi:hypothetical protein